MTAYQYGSILFRSRYLAVPALAMLRLYDGLRSISGSPKQRRGNGRIENGKRGVDVRAPDNEYHTSRKVPSSVVGVGYQYNLALSNGKNTQ